MNEILNKQQRLLTELLDNLMALDKAKQSLKYSIERCEMLLPKSDYSDMELESCEALTARFARASDMLTQKVLKGIFLFLKENPETFLDKCHLAEKIGIVNSEEELIAIRELRNEIAHEYRLENMAELFEAVVKYSKKLCDVIDQIKNYVEKLKQKI